MIDYATETGTTETGTNEQNAGRRIKASQETGPMTDDSQSRKDANISKVDMLRPKTTRRVGCWNVRTLYQTGKLAQVIKEMQSYKIELLGVSEQNGPERYPPGCYEMDSCRKEEKRSAQINMEKISRERNESGWLELEPGPALGI